jgi:anti-sigma factor RsiW
MNCPFREDTGVYVLGALTPQEHLQLRRHLKDCRSCQIDVADLLAVLPILRNTSPVLWSHPCHALFIDWSLNN